MPTTYLFVPGNRHDRFDKAFASGAGVVILDLEDAVAPAEKAGARESVRLWCAAHPGVLDRVAVRINSVDSDQHLADIGALRAAGVRQVMLPKAESADAIARLADCSDAHIKILPLIESARGVREADAIAAAAGVFRLAFGTIDYALDLGIHGELVGDVPGFTFAAGRIANASRCAGLPSPIAGVTADVSDDAALLADLRFARSFGFGAKMCIHPRQIAVVHEALLPSAEELSWARRILAAAADNDGAIKVDGKMVDRPIVARAQAMVDRVASADDADRKEN